MIAIHDQYSISRQRRACRQCLLFVDNVSLIAGPKLTRHQQPQTKGGSWRSVMSILLYPAKGPYLQGMATTSFLFDLCAGSLLDQCLKLGQDGAGNVVNLLAVLEELEGWHGADAAFLGDLLEGGRGKSKRLHERKEPPAKHQRSPAARPRRPLQRQRSQSPFPSPSFQSAARSSCTDRTRSPKSR